MQEVVGMADHFLQNQVFRHIFIRSRYKDTLKGLPYGTVNVWKDPLLGRGLLNPC